MGKTLVVAAALLLAGCSESMTDEQWQAYQVWQAEQWQAYQCGWRSNGRLGRRSRGDELASMDVVEIQEAEAAGGAPR